jgi:putative tryptophan/tyrosine transport system substrate-binding protein
MDRRIFLGVVAGALLAAPHAAGAQPAGKIYRVAIASWGPNDIYGVVFFGTLRDLGYVEGRNLAVERRSCGNQNERIPEIAAEVVSLKVDVIVAVANSVVRTLKQATTSIPIVMAGTSGPVDLPVLRTLAAMLPGLPTTRAPNSTRNVCRCSRKLRHKSRGWRSSEPRGHWNRREEKPWRPRPQP